MSSTQKTVKTALFAALVFVATFFIKIQTPAMGYIHPGDSLVLVSGIVLGPLHGAFAAGFGAMLADIMGGYLSYAPATLFIKAAVSIIPALLYKHFHKISLKGIKIVPLYLLGEIAGIALYFLYDLILFGIAAGASFAAGLSIAAAELPFNLVQGLFGVVVASLIPLRKLHLIT